MPPWLLRGRSSGPNVDTRQGYAAARSAPGETSTCVLLYRDVVDMVHDLQPTQTPPHWRDKETETEGMGARRGERDIDSVQIADHAAMFKL